MNGKVKYSGTEKIEKKIFDELEEKIDARLDFIEDEMRLSVISEIREELQPETVPYDRMRLIEQRLHELSTTQDGIVREIVDIKTTLNALSKQFEKKHSPDIYEAPKAPSYDKPKNGGPSYSNPYESPFSSYTPYPPATLEPAARPTKIPGFGSQPAPAGPATPIVPVAFNARKSDGWEYQEFVPAKKNYAEPEKFVPAKTIPASNDPFYFADTADEILDVTALNEPAPQAHKPAAPPFENMFSIQKIPKKVEQELPDTSEYIIGTNQVKRKNDEDEDYNAGCEYIIAEKDTGSRKFGQRGGKRGSEKKERVISNNDSDTDVFTYE